MAEYRVLQLVTAEEIFFRQQIEALEARGVKNDICAVPGGRQIDGAMPEKRGVSAYLRYLPKVRRILRDGEYDLIHANYGLTAPFAVTQRHLPVVLTLWGSDVVGFDGLVTKTCVRWCDAVTVRSEEMRQILKKPEAQIVPSGVNMERFRPIDQTQAREAVGWDPEGAIVLFPYDPSYERKDYPLAQRVVEAASRKMDRDISLQTISGVPHDQVPLFMNAANCVLLTAKYEGSPNVVKEALSCNVPVVSTDVGDVRRWLDAVSPGGVGREADALVELLVDVLSAGHRPNGREAVEEVNWERITQRFLDIYDEVTR